MEQAVIHVLGFASPSSIRSVDFGVESIVPAAEVTRLAGRTTPYNILVALDVRNFAIEGQMELAQGAVLRTVLGEDKITSVRFDGSIMRVEIEGRDSGLNSGPGWFVGINAEFEPLSDIVYVLVNKKTKTVLMPSRTSTGMGANAYCISPIRGSLQFVLPPSNNAAPAATEWQLVKIRLGNRHRAIKSFTANMSLKEIPKIEMDPEWFIER